MLWSVLSLETKMVAMFACAIIIALSILIVICFLIPDTWWIWPWTAESVTGESEGGPHVRLRDFRHWPTADSTETIVDSSKKPRLSRQELCCDSSGYSLDSGRPGSYRGSSSNASSVVSEAGLSPCSSRSGSMTTLQTPMEEPNRPQVHLTLQSSVVIQSDGIDVKQSAIDQLLIVTIENATDLPSRSYVDTVDPSISVRLERRNNHRLGSLMGALIGTGGIDVNGRRNSHQVLAEDSTCPVVYHSRHPRFHHPVTIAVPKSTHLKDCQLVVRVEDKDKLVGVTELGRCTVDLRELDFLAGWLDVGNAERKESIVRLSRFIDITKPEEKGAILLGLSFLPTSQRITVQMTQCNRLAKTADASPTQAVVRLFLLNESGRVLKKRKTAPFDYPKGGGGRIELNELFHVDVDIERWDRCVILLVLSRILSHEVLATSQASSQESSSLDGRPPTRSPPVYHHSGHVALGKRVTGYAERIHWNSAFQSPRRVISQWHCLH